MDNSFYASLGIPLSAISSCNIEKKITQISFPSKNKMRTIVQSKQIDCFRTMQKLPRTGLCCIYSASITYQRITAFRIFRRAIGHAFKTNTNMPYWHQLTNQFDDNVSRRELLQQPSLLVIDGITDKSMPAKIELARDIITRYSNIPVLLLVTTVNPARFTESTFIQPNRLLYLEDRREI